MADNIVRVLDGFVYRSGSPTDLTMTPRPDDDVSSEIPKAGLSAWRTLEAAVKIGKRAQKIDLAMLDPAVLGCFQDEQGHVSIVPIDPAGNLDMIKLTEWAATRGSPTPHPFTTMVVKAIVEPNVRRKS
jgi:hypothetical protein